MMKKSNGLLFLLVCVILGTGIGVSIGLFAIYFVNYGSPFTKAKNIPIKNISFNYHCQAQRNLNTSQNGHLVCFVTNTGNVSGSVRFNAYVDCKTLDKKVWKTGEWQIKMKSGLIESGNTQKVTSDKRKYVVDKNSEGKLQPDVMICDTIRYSNISVYNSNGKLFRSYGN